MGKAMINPNDGQMIARHAGRIKTLRIAIEKASAKGDADRVSALQSELDDRLAAVNEFKAQLDKL